MKNMKKISAIILVGLFVGCSAMQPYTQPVKFSCDPDGVTLVVNGQKRECPITLDMPKNREIAVEGYKEGYLPYKKTVSYHNSTTFYLDIIGTCICLVPVFGLMTPGAKELDETDISVILVTK